MLRLLHLPLIWLSLGLLVTGQDKVTTTIKSDLESAQKRLLAQREKQQAERTALSETLTAKQAELLTKRRQAEISRRSIADQEAFLKNLRTKDYASEAEVQSLSEALRAYGLRLHTKSFPGAPQNPRLEGVFGQSDDKNAQLVSRFSALEAGLEELEKALGGAVYDTQVSDEDGKITPGQVLAFGPSHWFQATDKSVSGSYHLSRSGEVATLDQEEKATATALFAGEESKARLDITGGKARALAKLKSGPLDLIIKGGAWVYPILLLALAALFCAIKKFFELRGIKDPSDDAMTALAQQYLSGDAEGAQDAVNDLSHPIAKVLPHTMQVLTSDQTDLGEEVLYERLIPVKETLRGWLPFMAITAAVAPLLGLLGTVSGLIKTFSVIAIEGTGEAQSISGGISEALITTLFGLAVAIPTFMAHALLSRRARGIEQTTERLALVFLNAIRKENTLPLPSSKAPPSLPS